MNIFEFQARLFLTPVNSRSYPSYYEMIKDPIDLQKIRQRVLAHTYNTRESFLNDIKRIVENSRKYNGEHSSITRDAQTIVAACFQKFAAVSLTRRGMKRTRTFFIFLRTKINS